MNLTPEFAPDARSQWRQLDPLRQEVVLDVIEDLLADELTDGWHISVNKSNDGAMEHFVVVSVFVDLAGSTLSVLGIEYDSRPLL